MSATATSKKAKEFMLSGEVPEAVLETRLAASQKSWQARSDAAAEAVKFPTAPYRIIGDEKAGAWFAEAAKIERSPTPTYDNWILGSSLLYFGGDPDKEYSRAISALHAEQVEKLIAKLAADRPKAKLQWERVGRRRRGWMTYAKAHRWLTDWLEPVRDESIYFAPTGEVAKRG